MILEISPAEDWLASVDSRRPIFAEVTRRVDATLGVETSHEVSYALRTAAVAESSLRGPMVPQASRASGQGQAPGLESERFLDAEIVAIYW